MSEYKSAERLKDIESKELLMGKKEKKHKEMVNRQTTIQIQNMQESKLKISNFRNMQ